MNKPKYYTIAAIIIVFIIFACINIFKTTSYDVLKVISPFEVIIDKNSNGVEDDDENLVLNTNYEFISKDNNRLQKVLNLDDNSYYAFAYLTEKYINDVLLDKKIIIKTNNNIPEIIVSGEKYTNILYKSGYIFKKGKPINLNAYNKRLEQIKKADYKIYNIKSNKYHNLNCEFGRKAHNYVLLAKYQIPKGALPCKYCIGEKNKNKSIIKNKNVKKNIKRPQLVFSSGAIKFFLTDYTTNLIPNRYGNTELCKELVKQIDSAKISIDIAIYGYDRVPKIENAIKKAVERGVKVRLVHDIDSNNNNIYANTFEFSNIIKNCACDKALSYVKNKIQYTNSIMHNKFYIFDNSIVITGSANLSYTDMSDFNANSAVLIKSKRIASIYTQEFEQMYNLKFHNLKTSLINKENIQVGDSIISVYFSPKDKIIQNVLVPVINKAKKYIYVPVFIITDNNLTNALISAKKRGVDVKVIVDATNAKNTYSKHSILRKENIPVKTENYAGKLHSKSIIIDDTYTISGSMNFSKSGESKNDENIIVIKNEKLTKYYKNYFLYIWNRISNYWLYHDVSAESRYSIGSCSDGIDNDYDGKTDSYDEGCKLKSK